ncbi:MAG TPA: peptidoglycan editing factor PgeF [Burkholderiaceae bacterium]|nr:peptidoglycan editing factor PgeF [Burkholderiaceae bacterium]
MTSAPEQFIVPDWPAPPSVHALITTRAGGVSTGPYAGPDGSGGMNLGRGSGDDPIAVEANRARLRALLPAEPAWLKQVHAAAVADAAQVAREPSAGADAAITDRPGCVAVVMVADCMPVLLADDRGRCVGVVHAGWRGLAAGVVQKTARAMRERLGDPAARLIAYLGPAIGPDHFEVGDDVLAAMADGLPGAEAAFARHGKRYLADLFILGRLALRHENVEAIYGGGVCTVCDPRRFYSHRRDRATGRHAALIWIAPGGIV